MLDGDLAPRPQKEGTAPNFRPMFVVAKRPHGSRYMLLATNVGLGPLRIVLHGDPAPGPKRSIAPNFWPMSIVAKRSIAVSATAEHLLYN